MSEPTTTAAVPKPEDKPTEVTPAIVPSPETVVETSVPVPDAPKEDVKGEEPAKTETPAVTTDAAEPSSASGPDPKEAKEGDKPAEGSPKEERPKSPSFFARLMNMKIPRPKSEKKKEKAPAPVAEEPVVPAQESSPADAKPEDKPEAAPADPVKEEEVAPPPAESEAPVPPTTQEEAKHEDGAKEDKQDVRGNPVKSAIKMGRRLSHLSRRLFPDQKRHADTPVKVNEEPPKIKEPAPVGPLENPAADSTPATGEEPRKEETKEANEPPKIIESTPAPVVATA